MSDKHRPLPPPPPPPRRTQTSTTELRKKIREPVKRSQQKQLNKALDVETLLSKDLLDKQKKALAKVNISVAKGFLNFGNFCKSFTSYIEL